MSGLAWDLPADAGPFAIAREAWLRLGASSPRRLRHLGPESYFGARAAALDAFERVRRQIVRELVAAHPGQRPRAERQAVADEAVADHEIAVRAAQADHDRRAAQLEDARARLDETLAGLHAAVLQAWQISQEGT